MKRIIVIGLISVALLVFSYSLYRSQKNYQAEQTKKYEEIRKVAEEALKLAKEAQEKAVKEDTERLAKEAQEKAHEAALRVGTVMCPQCGNRFEPQKNKAPLLKAIVAAGSAGATVLAATGAYIGAGTGIAVGGVGAFPGTIVGGIIGGVGGAVTGGIGAAWYRDRQVQCPSCGEIFENPLN